MKNRILLIAFIGLILSTNAQDILKLKTIKTYYGNLNESSLYYRIGELDNAIINPDSLPFLFPQLSVVNISNDTFSSNVKYEVIMDFLLYADTGLLLADRNVSQKTPIFIEFLPNDTVNLNLMSFRLIDIINYIKEENSIELEQISYWKMITGISYTNKDGTYSEKVFYEGADTSIFYIVKTPVNIQEVADIQINVSIFPNPTQSQFTITNTKNTTINMFDILGQKVKQIVGKEDNTIIYTEDLPAGIYVLKMEKGNAISTKKVQIIK